MIPIFLLGSSGDVILLLGRIGRILLPRAKFHWSVSFICMGLIFLSACAMASPSRQPAATSNLLFPVSPPTTTPLNLTGQPPVILDIQTHRASTPAGVVISADIHFKDPDGDAQTIAFETVQSTQARFTLEPEQIVASLQEQVQGTSQTVEWICYDSTFVTQFRVVVLDSAGHHSNLVPMLFDCE